MRTRLLHCSLAGVARGPRSEGIAQAAAANGPSTVNSCGHKARMSHDPVAYYCSITVQPCRQRKLLRNAVVFEAVLEEDSHVPPLWRHPTQDRKLLQVARMNCRDVTDEIRITVKSGTVSALVVGARWVSVG